MFAKQTIRDIDLKGKTVLLRAELDAPLSGDGKKVLSNFRLEHNLETLKYLQDAGCKTVIIGKLGRPKNGPEPSLSLSAVAKRLSELSGYKIKFVQDCVGPEVKQACQTLKPGDIVMLENLRFYAEEDAGDENFAKAIIQDTGAEVFVQDCFASVHHAAASIDVIPKHLTAVAGLSLAKEVDTITSAMQEPERPLMAIVGGAKIADKIEILEKFIEMADIVAIGGGLANTFLAAQGIDVAESLYEKSDLPTAKRIIKLAAEQASQRPFVFAVPHDVVVAKAIDKKAPTRVVDFTTHVLADIQHYPKRVPVSASTLQPDEMILDIGPFSASYIAGAVQLARTVVWNGSMGVTETESLQGPIGPTAHGTQLVIEALLGDLGHKPFTVVGGGDTVGYIESRQLTTHFNHVSTGGGASLELMSGRKLPGVEALKDKK